MFIVCEPIAWGLEHVPFNAALIKIIRCAFPDRSIHFYGERDHSQEVRKEIGADISKTVQWVPIILPIRHSGFYRRVSTDFRTVKNILDILNKNHSGNVLVITGNPSVLWALKYYTSAIHKDNKVQVIIHGDFSKLRYRASLKHHLNPFYHIGSLKTALRVAAHKHIQYIVLEEAVRDAVVEYMPFLRDSIGVLDHPIPVSEQRSIENNEFELPIQFGFLGQASERKGFSKFLGIASDISRLFPGLANFHFIGWINNPKFNLNIPGLDFLVNKPSTRSLNRDEYIRRLSKLHFVCLFYEREYEFTASGVLLDCISWGKPLIASKLPIFENLAIRFGDIGYLCETDEFSKTIGNILSNVDSFRYKQQVLNILRVKLERTPESLSGKYRELVCH